MIISINNNYKTNSFKATPRITRVPKAPGDLRYATARQLNSIKEAVKDILTNKKNNGISEKVIAVSEEFNVSFDKGIKIASAFGVGSSVSLFA